MKIETPYKLLLADWEHPGQPPIEGASGTVLVDPSCSHSASYALEDLFAMYNRGSGAEVPFEHRSLSVGDLVLLGETTWRVASVGWEKA